MLVTPTRGTKTTIPNKPPIAPERISRVFIVDDHPAAREGLAVRIHAEPDLRVCGEAPDLGEACLPELAVRPVARRDNHRDATLPVGVGVDVRRNI